MYQAPVGEIAFTLKLIAGLAGTRPERPFGELGEDVADAILSEAGRFAGAEIAPLCAIGDRQGATLAGAEVTMPDGWKALYARFAEGGWAGLAGPPEFGGQGLPQMLSMAALEMWNGGSPAFGIGPTLTMGAVEAIARHGSDELKGIYLDRLVAGTWMGTMNLTEAQAGSDLGTVATRAEPAGDGSYRLFGQKIFITYGEHDLSENIIHLVLARVTGAPPGSRGLSLFLVPKFLVEADGRLGARNDLFCARLEDKLGLHAAPTCTMIYGDGFAGGTPGARGCLVGAQNRGLAAMFTMMNNARLAVGIQGVAVAECATQQALAYARERRQGRAAGFSGSGMSPIVHHPDVVRMLLTMQALTSAARAICYACAHAIDLARAGGADGRHWQERADLLTPMAKAFATDVGVEVASLGVQVHGGMGYIEDTGAARLYRDARIAPIYEGTNGIQAIDLVTRKLALAEGRHLRLYLDELAARVDRVAADNRPGLGSAAAELGRAVNQLARTTAYLHDSMKAGQEQAALAGASAYLRLFGLTLGGLYLAEAALADPSGSRTPLARFFADHLIGESEALAGRILGGSDSLAEAAAQLMG